MLLKRLIPVFLLLLMTIEASAQQSSGPDQAILKIDSQGHQGMIKDIMFTNDGKQLVSVSDDKTIRVWDVATGKLQRTLRGQISAGHGGKFFAGALSPDDQWLAVGGWLDRQKGYDLKRLAQIRILPGS